MRVWAEISKKALYSNIQKIAKRCDCAVMPIIKADGYGHGAAELARFYEGIGIRYFGVATLQEAVELRDAGVTSGVLILGYLRAMEVDAMIQGGFTATICGLSQAEEMAKRAQSFGKDLKAHIKIDTGMNRLGFCYHDEKKDKKALEDVKKICNMKGIIAEGIYTHFAASDERDNPLTERQFELFSGLLAELSGEGISLPAHCCNSGGVLNFPEMHLSLVRPGILLYGLLPDGSESDEFIPALSLYSMVTNVHDLRRGDGVSYGHTFKAKRAMKVATVSVGYADGYPRLLSNKAHVLINGQEAKILGRVCMDQIICDISHIEDVKIGSKVTLIGKDGDKTVTANDIAKFCGTINYEIVCSLSRRVGRIYVD